MPYRLNTLHHLSLERKRRLLFYCRLLQFEEDITIFLAHFLYIWRDLPMLFAIIRDGDKHPWVHWWKWMHSPRRMDRRPLTLQQIAIDATIFAGVVIPIVALINVK